MGAYLSQPVTEKYSCEETLPNFSYGASSMQGWRMSQEDAHNCIPHFDTNTTLFAVYDGHGGAEVAQYCAINLPDYIKSVSTYKSGNMAQALEDAFLGFDETLIQPRVVTELKQMAGIFDQQSDTEENEVNHLFAEANMPIEEVLAKYNSGAGANPQLARLQGEKPQSPFLRAKKCLEEKEQMKKQKIALEEGTVAKSDADLIKCEDKNSDSLMVNGDKSHAEPEDGSVKQTGCDSPEQETAETKIKEMVPSENERTTTQDSGNCKTSTGTVNEALTSSSSSEDAHPGCSRDTVPGTSLGKRAHKTQGVSVVPDSDDSSNTDDETYEEGIPYADETDSEEGDNDIDQLEEKGEDEEEDEEEEEEEEEESEESEEEEQDDDDEEDEDMLASSEREKPGSDSGCTAVVALLRGSELYVANAGDSRCIVCRNGKAIDMSVDHKPEDELEMKRIMNAGGKVEDGRVNGGLNLSRAIGDHTYKQNPAVPPRDQMISALPDIRTLTIDPDEDEFMVLACDGIWNYLSSQEVADFVSERLKRGTDKLSLICEELFDHCLAPHTGGDGTGCDNMTAIIVKFHKTFGQTDSVKRSLEGRNGLEDGSEAKRMKPTDDGDTRPSTVE